MLIPRLAIASTVMLCTISFAQSYPSKPVHIVVPYAAGGGVDAMTRRVAQKLTEQTGTTFFVENKAGASGTIGTAQVARSAADGYTLLANDGTYSILPYVFKTLPWDYPDGLVPVTTTSLSPAVLAVSASSPFNSLDDLIRFAKANPDTITYGTGGVGSSLHFATEAFAQSVGIQLRHIPFKGAGEAIAAIVSGTVDLGMGGPSSALALIKGGRLKSLAVSGTHRMAALADVPTFEEQGVKYEMNYWTGLAAPRGTPPAVVARIQSEVRKAMETPEVKEYFDSIGAELGGMAPDQFARFIQADVDRWKRVATDAGITLE